MRCIQSPNLYLAQRLETMKVNVFRTHESVCPSVLSLGVFGWLNSVCTLQAAIVQGVMVSHSEEDLLCVRVAYLRQTGTSLYTALQVRHTHTHGHTHTYTIICTLYVYPVV